MSTILAGQMMDRPYSISSLLEHRAKRASSVKFISRHTEGDIHRYTMRDAAQRQKVEIVQRLKIGKGDRIMS